MGWLDLLVLTLASYRLTHLVVFDSVLGFLRKWAEGKPVIGAVVSCYWCCGIWMSALLLGGFMAWPVHARPLLWILAIAGGQALLENFTDRQ
jgi:hypothetical protein